MIEQTSRRSDEQVDALGELVGLGLAVRAAHDDGVRVAVAVLGGQDLARDAEDLERKLARGRDDDGASAYATASAYIARGLRSTSLHSAQLAQLGAAVMSAERSTHHCAT